MTEKEIGSDEDFAKMTFSEHFVELRQRLLRCIIAVLAIFVICFCLKDYVVGFIVEPYNKLRGTEGFEDLGPLEYIGPTEGFIFYIKACFFSAVFLAGPWILFQLWGFIAAGLYKAERKRVMKVLPLSIVLFIAGMSFGYFLLFPLGLEFLLNFAKKETAVPSITVSKYFSLFTLLILIMGFIFQTPLIMVVLTRMGLVTAKFFAKKRKFFILGAFIVSALFTPPDWVTQCLLAGPLLVLFELGILLSRGVGMRKKGDTAAPTGPKSDSKPQEGGPSKERARKTANSTGPGGTEGPAG